MNIVMLTPVATPRQGVIAKEHGKTEKGYIYEPGDIITGKYVIDKRSYASDYTETANDGVNVTFVKTRQMAAVSTSDLISDIDGFNANVSEKWIAESVKAKGIAYDGRTAFVDDEGKLTLVESEKIAIVPDDCVVLFNIDADGKYYNVYYCPKDTVRAKYTGYEGIV